MNNAKIFKMLDDIEKQKSKKTSTDNDTKKTVEIDTSIQNETNTTMTEDKQNIETSNKIDTTTKIKKFAIFGFIVPPMFVSIVSMIHLWTFFEISNHSFWAFIVAICFELISIASLLALTVLDKISKNALWWTFFGVAIYQIIGNIFSSFMYLNQNSLDNMKWAIEMFGMPSGIASYRIMAIIQGACLPILSLTLIKLAVDYMDSLFLDEKNEAEKKRRESKLK